MTDDLDHTRRYKLAGAMHRGRRKPGLSSDVLGWPWHPRRLATARYRGQHGGRDADGELAQGRPAAADLSAPAALWIRLWAGCAQPRAAWRLS